MERLDYARMFKHKGWRPIILHPDGKDPVFRNWFNREVTEAELEYHIRELNRNFGVILDRALVCDKDGRDRSADLFLRRMGPFYSPMVVQTKKGKHYFAGLPAGMEAKTVIRFRSMKLDLLTGVRYVVGAGSEVAGHTYTLNGEILAPSELPQAREALVNLLIERPRKEVRASIRAPFVESENQLRRYVDQIDLSVQGQNGSRAIFVACLKILSLVDGDPEAAWPWVLHYNRTRCTPQWDEETEDGPNSAKRKLREALKCWKPK